MKLLDPLPLYVLGREEPIEPGQLRGIIAELDPTLVATGARRTRHRAVIIISSAVILLGVIILVAILITGDRSAIRTLTNPMFIAPMVVGVAVPFLIVRAERLRTLARVMLRHRCCPHCGYSLRELPREDDGVTACPECGSVWRLDDIEAADVPDPEEVARENAGRSRFRIMLIIGLTALALFVVAFLIHEFNN